MTVARPRTLAEVLDALSADPDADLLAGGTDLMVEINAGHRRPRRVIALRRVGELQGWRRDRDVIDVGATVTYRDVEQHLADDVPALAVAARTVGSPQIRNAGTIGGNIGTASPAGDTLPVLTALDAHVVCDSPRGRRTLPLADFVTGAKRTDRGPDEVISRILIDRCRGPQQFLKVGPRSAMAISIVCLALVADMDRRRVRVGLGSVTPRPTRPHEAEEFISAAVDWDAGRVAPDAVDRFGRMVAATATPITDHRGTAEYRTHAIGVLACRALRRAVADLASHSPMPAGGA